MGENCCDGICAKCLSMKYIVAGVVIILVRIYTNWDIWIVLGTMVAIKGLLKLAMPNGCGHCKTPIPIKKGKK